MFILLCLTFLVLLALRLVITFKNGDKNLPPGPKSFPGNLGLLSPLPHRTLHELGKRHGDIMFLKLGQVQTVVVSSPKASEQCLRIHDDVFASRPKIEASKLMSYGIKGVGFQEYGQYWRDMRKFCILKLLSPQRARSFAQMRREETEILVDRIDRAAEAGEVADVTHMVQDLLQNMVCRMLLGGGISMLI